MKTIVRAGVLLAPLLLAACGGGGSGVAAPDSVPLAQALASIQHTGFDQTFSVAGTASNGTQSVPVTGSVRFTASAYGGATTFAGSPALVSTTTVSGTLTGPNGTSAPFSASVDSFVTPAFVPLGSQSTGSYCEKTTYGPLPAAASVGASGVYATFACYTDSSRSTPLGTETISYRVAVGTGASNLAVTETDASVDAQGNAIGSIDTTFLVDTSGQVTFAGFSLTVTSAGVTTSIASR